MHLHRPRASGHPRGSRRGAGDRGGRQLTLTARPASAAEIAGWDALVAATGRAHLLQMTGWATVKAATGWVARRYVLEGAGLAQVLLRPLPFGVSVAYAPRGPLVVPERLAEAVVALRAALAAERCASLLCDPEVPADPELTATLAGVGVRPSAVYVQPRRTLLFDLTAEPETLLGGMRKKTRQYIHKAERAGVITEETDDLDRFLAVLRTVASRDRFALHDRRYFELLREAFPEALRLLIARVDTEDVGALLVVRLGDRAWELYGGWSGAHDEARPFYLLKWRAMLAMRQAGAQRYDMWGLADGPDDVLAGVEQFKLGFGGEVAEWIGALETPVRRALYPIWTLGARRRLAAAAR